jgi:Icc-related predicted phosphoesterase
MKLLVIADVHNEELKLPKADLTIIAGDFTNRGPVSFVERFLEDVPNDVLAVPGNMDPRDVLDVLELKGVSIHRKTVEIDGIRFFGFGGSSPTPFNTPFEFDDEEIEKAISGFKADIAVFHDTPYGFFDWINGKSVGSMAIRRWIESVKPKVVFCAHIHEHEGVAKLNDTLIVKVPPAYKRKAVLVEFDDLSCIIVRFINL